MGSTRDMSTQAEGLRRPATGRRGRVGACLVALALVGTATSGVASATVPGENGRIAFNRDGNIYTAGFDGGGVQRLTSYPRGGAGYPKWSPDGSRIAFTRGGWVWVMRADGTGRSRLFPGVQASWSRDGRQMAYHWGGAVVARRLPSGPVRVIEAYADSGGCPWDSWPGPSTSWSADGQVIYGVAEHGSTDDLCGEIKSVTAVTKAKAIDTGGSPAGVALTRWEVEGRSPVVDSAPRGAGYVFATDAGYGDGLNRLYVGGVGTRRQLTAERGVDTPTFSPDGRWVLYTQHRPGSSWKVRRVASDGRSAPVTLLDDASQPSVRPTR